MHYAGQAAIEKGYPALSDNLLQAVRQSGIALKTKIVRPPSMIRRRTTMCYYDVSLAASRRCGRCITWRGWPARFNNINILLVREITEDLYAAIEHEIVPGVVQSLKVVTEAACTRFFKFTFELARQQGAARAYIASTGQHPQVGGWPGGSNASARWRDSSRRSHQRK